LSQRERARKRRAASKSGSSRDASIGHDGSFRVDPVPDESDDRGDEMSKILILSKQ
jgi:hypothetical protein